MAMPETKPGWRVLFDLNVILDVLMHRYPYFADAARLWALAETGEIEGFVAGHSFTTLFYLYRQQSGAPKANQAIRQLLSVFAVACVDRGVIEAACELAWRDFEDAVQIMAAKEAGCHYLVTRNPKDFPGRQVTVILPADFLAVWSAGKAK